jgi:Nif-specific regulatory protein
MLTRVSSKIIVISGVCSGQVFPLDAAELTLGRDGDNTIGVPDPALSRRHCAFTHEPEGWRVRDLGSSNGTFVNGVQVQSQLLVEGDHITAGGSVLLYVEGRPPEASHVDSDGRGPLLTARLDASQVAYLQPHDSPDPGRHPSERGLRLLLGISTTINAIRDEAQLYRELLDLLFQAVRADEGAIVQAGAGDELQVLATRAAPGANQVRVEAGAVRRAISEGLAALYAGATADADAPAAGGRSSRVRCHMAVPIGVRGRILGCIQLAAHADAAFIDDDLHLVAAVGQISAIAIENVRRMAGLQREADRLHADLQGARQMIGESAAMQPVYTRIAKVARVESTVLITGETGTGKELAARAVHVNSARARRPFVVVNCAALAETLLESELFGHERGAFTGAVSQKKGRIELADGGTLFLDEIGELALPLQTKLLRVLQEREFERVGGTRSITVDVRVISATHRDLAQEVAAGRFRQDLYFRLNVVSIHLPPLRERVDDITPLAEHFVKVHGRKADRPVRGISPAALRCMLRYDWPGNVRELENAIERAIVLGSTETLLLDDLPEGLCEAVRTGTSPDTDLHGRVSDVKRRAIIEAFRKAGGSYTEAAKLLGVHPNYLHRLIRNLGIKSELEHRGP